MQRSIPNQIKPNRPETAMHPPRKAITKPLKCKLPKYDFHDPGAPSPELPKKAVEEHGYQRLTEMKLVSEDELQTKLDSTLNIRPFTYDYTSLSTDIEQQFILASQEEDSNNIPTNNRYITTSTIQDVYKPIKTIRHVY